MFQQHVPQDLSGPLFVAGTGMKGKQSNSSKKGVQYTQNSWPGTCTKGSNTLSNKSLALSSAAFRSNGINSSRCSASATSFSKDSLTTNPQRQVWTKNRASRCKNRCTTQPFQKVGSQTSWSKSWKAPNPAKGARRKKIRKEGWGVFNGDMGDDLPSSVEVQDQFNRRHQQWGCDSESENPKAREPSFWILKLSGSFLSPDNYNTGNWPNK